MLSFKNELDTSFLNRQADISASEEILQSVVIYCKMLIILSRLVTIWKSLTVEGMLNLLL